MDVGAEAGIERRIELANGDFARHGDVAATRDVGEIIDRRQRPSGLLRHRGQAAEKARYPETDAVFVGPRVFCRGDQRSECEQRRDNKKLRMQSTRQLLNKLNADGVRLAFSVHDRPPNSYVRAP